MNAPTAKNFTQLMRANKGQPLPAARMLGIGTQRIAGTPTEFNRLGQASVLSSISAMKVSSIFYEFQGNDFPFTNAEFDAKCGVVRLFSCFGIDGTNPSSGAFGPVITNADCGSSINIPFVALGLCLCVIPDGEAFSIPGAFVSPSVLSPAPGANPACPPNVAPGLRGIDFCGHKCDVADFEAFAAAHPGTTVVPADLTHGWVSTRWWEKFETTMQLQFIVNRRVIVVEEGLDVLCVHCPPTTAQGFAGDLRVAPQPIIRFANDVLDCKGFPFKFIPTDTIIDPATGASVHVAPGEPGLAVGSGDFGCSGAQRFWPFPCPILFCPGYRIDIQLVPQIACDALIAMREYSVANILSTAAEGGLQVGTLPVGQIWWGICLFGYELWPTAVLDFINCYVPAYSMQAQMLQGVPYVYDLMKKLDANGQGLDDGTKNRLYGILGSGPKQQ
jgi:hypothetical protein